jgi:Fur family zinc uptake transcriptional regulator|tara:strand:+ start:223 stop:588 length:366 start_codon:yes stop_codon:yes gene_type:complete
MKNTDIVLNIIKKSSRPLTAYSILELLKSKKTVQPMTVYRALNDLMKKSIIHKSNQNKTFLLCNHLHNKDHNPAIAICKKCGDTEELKSDLFNNLLKKFSIKKYSFSNYEVEVSTICRGCA